MRNQQHYSPISQRSNANYLSKGAFKSPYGEDFLNNNPPLSHLRLPDPDSVKGYI